MKTNYKYGFFIFVFAFFICNSFGQIPSIVWQNTIGGNGGEKFRNIRQTSDGGYILGGQSTSGISGDKIEASFGMTDYWILKIDDTGNIQWQKTFGGTDEDYLEDIRQTLDGGYIIAGWSKSDSTGNKTENSISGSFDFWVIKTDTIGNIMWQKTIGTVDEDELYSVQQSADGGLLLAGNTYENYWLVKLDSAGNTTWDKNVNALGSVHLSSFDQTNDGGYILGGYTDAGIGGDKTEPYIGFNDFWVVKLDSLRNIQWQNTIGGTSWDYLQSIQKTFDGGSIICGYSDSGISGDKTENSINSDYWVIKLDNNGNIQWQNTIQANSNDFAWHIEQLSDSGYVVSGHTQSDIGFDKSQANVGGDDYWILKLDANGNLLWQKDLGGSSFEEDALIHQNTDDSFIMGGWSNSNISGDKTENSFNNSYDYWIVKLNSGTTDINDPGDDTNGVSVIPNPSNGNFTLYGGIINATLKLYDISGRTIYSSTINSTAEHLQMNISDGIYFLEIASHDKFLRKKIVIR